MKISRAGKKITARIAAKREAPRREMAQRAQGAIEQ
jgi:hypothetical protein